MHAGTCLVQTSPIAEQMSPIFRQDAFDAFRRKLLKIPPRFLATDFGLETFWCGFEWNASSVNESSVIGADHEPADGEGKTAVGECIECAAGRRDGRSRARSRVISHGSSISHRISISPQILPPISRVSRCILLHHMSVVHADHRTIKSNLANWSDHVKKDALDNLRAYLTQTWPGAMLRSGDPVDRHHRLHARRCWGEWKPSEGQLHAPLVERIKAKAVRKSKRKVKHNVTGARSPALFT